MVAEWMAASRDAKIYLTKRKKHIMEVWLSSKAIETTAKLAKYFLGLTY